jgi:DNA-binding MarR family transcriptional regulator
MVAVIDELEAAGRVVRRRNPQDRRAYQLQLTTAGHAALQEAVRVVDRVQDEVFAPLNRGQRGQLQAMLTALLRHLTA